MLTPFVADKNITAEGSEHPGGDKGIHDRDVELLTQCQCKLGVHKKINHKFSMPTTMLNAIKT